MALEDVLVTVSVEEPSKEPNSGLHCAVLIGAKMKHLKQIRRCKITSAAGSGEEREKLPDMRQSRGDQPHVPQNLPKVCPIVSQGLPIQAMLAVHSMGSVC